MMGKRVGFLSSKPKEGPLRETCEEWELAGRGGQYLVPGWGIHWAASPLSRKEEIGRQVMVETVCGSEITRMSQGCLVINVVPDCGIWRHSQLSHSPHPGLALPEFIGCLVEAAHQPRPFFTSVGFPLGGPWWPLSLANLT